MGIFSDIKAMGCVQKIKRGGFAELSVSQIACLLINLPDAKSKLPPEQYEEIYSLFKEMRKCTTKMPMEMTAYCDVAEKIILEFDKIAPYEMYCGGNEFEYSILMSDILGANHKRIRELRRMIYQAEKRMKESDIAYENNKNILSEAFTDEELKKQISAGEFPASREEEYIRTRESLRLFIECAPEMRENTVAYIKKLEKELAELERK